MNFDTGLRNLIVAATLAAVVACFVGPRARADSAAALRPADLRCEYLVSPLGIDVPQPRLSWQIAATAQERGVAQTAYQVEVKDAKGSVVWDTKKTGGAAATYTRTSATSASCASTYCHGRFTGGTSATVSWTSTTQASCTSCHGNPPSTGDHSTHSSRLGCYNCHNAVVNSSRVIIDKTLHVNGVDNVKFGGTYNSRTVTGTWNASTRTCSSLSCHGSETW